MPKETITLSRGHRTVEATRTETNRAEFRPALDGGNIGMIRFQYNPAFGVWFDHLGYRWEESRE